MSVSLIALRFEIASGFSLLSHLNFSAVKYKKPILADTSLKKGDNIKEANSQPRELHSKVSVADYRGLREFQDISVETLHKGGTYIDKTTTAEESGSLSISFNDPINPKVSEDSTMPKNKDRKKSPSHQKTCNSELSKKVPSDEMKFKNVVKTSQEDTKRSNSKEGLNVRPEAESEMSEALKDSYPEEAASNMDLDFFQSHANMDDIKQKETHLINSGGSVTCNSERRSRLMHPTQISFSSGNHFVEVTKGLLHLYKENQRTPLAEEAERSEMLCILAVPAVLTTHDLLQFTAPVNDDIEHMRIIREAKPNQYMVLIKFRNQLSADEFYKNFNGMKFNTIEEEVCHLAFVAKVETIKESEEACLPLPGHTELPTCPVCLERMDESVEGILTILCNHSFHGSCLAKWGDTSCPVCRYCQTPEPTPDNRCFRCGSQDSLWICLICGHIGCGRYVDGHAYQHYLDTQHTYAMQLGNNRVWDYAGDNYVHRLVQNKTDGKLVELEPRWVENEEKMDSMQLEYTYLLTSQLEAQRHFFEDKLSRFEADALKQLEEMKIKTKHAIDERKQLEEKLCRVTKEKQALEKKLAQVTSKLNKLAAELKDEKEMNKCLRQNQQLWQQKLLLAEKNLKELKESKDTEVQELQEQVRDLMFYFDAQSKLQDVPNVSAQEIQEGQIVISEASGTSTDSSKSRKKKR